MRFEPEDYWKALILYGLNQATYKIGLGKTLISLSREGYTKVPWDTLSKHFLDQYLSRLSIADPMPQQANPARLTTMERIVTSHQSGKHSFDHSIGEVGAKAFGDVIHRFHKLPNLHNIQGMFYKYEFGKELELTDNFHSICENLQEELISELDARWGLLEGAFSICQGNYQLANDLRLTYIAKGYDRKNLTDNVPFLQGYQGNICFYCGESMKSSDIHVDHVLPRQVIQHDEIWNLVLTHSFCNEQKTDRLVGGHFIGKLIARNENIIGSNHPWKKKIIEALGGNPRKRSATLSGHYNRVRSILGPYYWGGDQSYNPSNDPFYRRLITVLNNGRET